MPVRSDRHDRLEVGFGGVELRLASRVDRRSGHAYKALLRQATTGGAGPGDESDSGERVALSRVPQRRTGAQGTRGDSQTDIEIDVSMI